MRIAAVLFFCVGVAFGFSCNETPVPGKSDTAIVQHTVPDSGKIFILPAPLQVPTLMRLNCSEPEMDLLSPDSGFIPAGETQYNLSLNLGICIADAAYSGMYGQRQPMLNYLSRADLLMKKLHLGNLHGNYLSRIRENPDNRDSLSVLLLSLDQEVQQQLNSEGEDQAAFYITSGCYLENLAVFLSGRQISRTHVFPQLLAQQKIWLDNLANAVSFFPPNDDTQDLYNTFYTLQHYFMPAQVTPKDGVPSCTMNPGDLELLRKKAVQLRNEAFQH